MLRAAIENGVRDGIFGYASGKRPDGSYEGFKFKESVMANLGDRDLIVSQSKSEETMANRSAAIGGADMGGAASRRARPEAAPPGSVTAGGARPEAAPPVDAAAGKRRFSGSVEVDAGNLSRLDDVRDEIIALLADRGLRLNVRLEIQAESDEAMSPDLLRALKTNSKLLDEFGLS